MKVKRLRRHLKSKRICPKRMIPSKNQILMTKATIPVKILWQSIQTGEAKTTMTTWKNLLHTVMKKTMATKMMRSVT